VAEVINLFDSGDEAGDGDGDDIDDILAEAANPTEPVVDGPEATRPKFARPARVTTRAQEELVEQFPGHTAEPVVQLLAVWGEKGQVFVAKAIDGTPVEQYRKPTAAEWNLLKAQGRMVKGGLAAAEVAPVAAPKSMWPKVLLGGLAIAAVGGAAWYYTKKREDSMEDDVEELD